MAAENLDCFASEFDEDFDNEDPEPPIDPTPGDELLWLAQKGLIERAKELLEMNPELVKHQDQDGYSPLHRAAYSNQPDMVNLLLSKGAPVTLATENGWLPLHSACRWGNYSCATLLLMHNSPINDTTTGGQTALHLAAGCRTDKKCLRLLLSWPGVKTDIENDQKETAYQVALRNTAKHQLFHVSEPCFHHI